MPTIAGKNLPRWLDTTAWAKAQEEVIAGTKPRSFLTQKFTALRVEAQALNGVTNLTIRHDVLVGHPLSALVDMKTLIEDGIYIEGASYFKYAMAAFAVAKSGMDVTAALAMADVKAAYDELRAPDGTIPLPECSAETDPAAPAQTWRGVRYVGPYLVARAAGLYVLINLDLSPLGHRRNLHAKPAFGQVVVYGDLSGTGGVGGYGWGAEAVAILNDRLPGRWYLPPRRYEGFTYANVLKEHELFGLHPAAVPADWRFLKGYKVEWEGPSESELENFSMNPPPDPGAVLKVRVTYRYPRRLFGLLPGRKVVRRISLSYSNIRVEDECGSDKRAVFELHTAFGFRFHDHARQ